MKLIEKLIWRKIFDNSDEHPDLLIYDLLEEDTCEVTRKTESPPISPT